MTLDIARLVVWPDETGLRQCGNIFFGYANEAIVANRMALPSAVEDMRDGSKARFLPIRVAIAALSSPDNPATNSFADSAFENDALVAMKITREGSKPSRSMSRRIG